MKYDYFYHEKMYSQDKCNEISDSIVKLHNANFTDMPSYHTVKNAKVSMAKWKDCKNFLAEFEDFIHQSNNENFGFDIYRFTDFEAVHHNVYSAEFYGEYGWHCDSAVDKMYDSKLTVIINVSSEPYEGGNFELFLQKPFHVKPLDIPGSVIVFPSYMQHRVTPITKGVRKSVSIWVRGPLFR
jgi:PKHD-type hydroxylase